MGHVPILLIFVNMFLKAFICCISIILSIRYTNAQCGFEEFYNMGIQRSSGGRLLEINNHLYALWEASVDTNLIDDASYDNEIWISKYDSCGNRLWKNHYGFNEFSEDFIEDAMVTQDSCLLILGYSEYTGLANNILYKIGKDGTLHWKKVYGTFVPQLYPSSLLYNPYRNSYLMSGTKSNGFGYAIEADTTGILMRQGSFLLNNDTQLTFESGLTIDITIGLANSQYRAIAHTRNNYKVYFYDLDSNMQITKVSTPYDKHFTNFYMRRPIYDYNTGILTFVGGSYIITPSGPTKPAIVQLDSTGSLVNMRQYDERSYVLGPDVTKSNLSGYLLFRGNILHFDDSLYQTRTLEIQNYEEQELEYALQLSDGSIAGIGSSIVRTKGSHIEVYIVKSNPDGSFTNLRRRQEEKPPSPSLPKEAATIYPNPSDNGWFQLKGITQGSIKVVDIAGKPAYEGSFTNAFIDLSQLPEGMYYAEIRDAETQEKFNRKLVICY
jgi:hypothetical protein